MATSAGDSRRPCRLYCTHTTFTESVLEDATGEAGAKVLGYSVRASSLDASTPGHRAEIRDVFRTVERFLAYELPGDTPAGEKERLHAASAPRRLFFIPTAGPFQVVGQICYRSHDTAGRPGSYFADIVAVPRQDGALVSARECVQLWGETPQSAWWCDSKELAEAQESSGRRPVAPGPRPPAGAGRASQVAAGQAFAEAVRQNAPPVIDDDLLEAFLSCRTVDEFKGRDPHGVIPPRWHTIDREVRQRLLERLVRATIGILSLQDSDRKDADGKSTDRNRSRLVVAAEPSVAALLFYGVLRLLPDGIVRGAGGRTGVSFSTFDSAPERTTVNLAATTFYGQEHSAAELPSDLRCFSCNTFRRVSADFKADFKYANQQGYCDDKAATGDYARWSVERAAKAKAGFAEVDSLCELLEETAPGVNAASLDDVVIADREVRDYLDGRVPGEKLGDNAGKKDANDFRRRLFASLIRESRRDQFADDFLDVAGRCLQPDDWEGRDETIRAILEREIGRLACQWGEQWFAGRVGKGSLPNYLAVAGIVALARKDNRLPDCLASRNDRKEEVFDNEVLRAVIGKLGDRAEGIVKSSFRKHGDRILALVFDVFKENPATAASIATGILVERLAGSSLQESQKWQLLAGHGAVARKLKEAAGSSSNAEWQELVGLVEGLFGRGVTPQKLASVFAPKDKKDWWSPPGLKTSADAMSQWARISSDSQKNGANVARCLDFFEALAPLARAARMGEQRPDGVAIERVRESLWEVLRADNAEDAAHKELLVQDPDHDTVNIAFNETVEVLCNNNSLARSAGELLTEWVTESDYGSCERSETSGGSGGGKWKERALNTMIVGAAAAFLALVGGVYFFYSIPAVKGWLESRLVAQRAGSTKRGPAGAADVRQVNNGNPLAAVDPQNAGNGQSGGAKTNGQEPRTADAPQAANTTNQVGGGTAGESAKPTEVSSSPPHEGVPATSATQASTSPPAASSQQAKPQAPPPLDSKSLALTHSIENGKLVVKWKPDLVKTYPGIELKLNKAGQDVPVTADESSLTFNLAEVPTEGDITLTAFVSQPKKAEAIDSLSLSEIRRNLQAKMKPTFKAARLVERDKTDISAPPWSLEVDVQDVREVLKGVRKVFAKAELTKAGGARIGQVIEAALKNEKPLRFHVDKSLRPQDVSEAKVNVWFEAELERDAGKVVGEKSGVDSQGPIECDIRGFMEKQQRVLEKNGIAVWPINIPNATKILLHPFMGEDGIQFIVLGPYVKNSGQTNPIDFVVEKAQPQPKWTVRSDGTHKVEVGSVVFDPSDPWQPSLKFEKSKDQSANAPDANNDPSQDYMWDQFVSSKLCVAYRSTGKKRADIVLDCQLMPFVDEQPLKLALAEQQQRVSLSRTRISKLVSLQLMASAVTVSAKLREQNISVNGPSSQQQKFQLVHGGSTCVAEGTVEPKSDDDRRFTEFECKPCVWVYDRHIDGDDKDIRVWSESDEKTKQRRADKWNDRLGKMNPQERSAKLLTGRNAILAIPTSAFEITVDEWQARWQVGVSEKDRREFPDIDKVDLYGVAAICSKKAAPAASQQPQAAAQQGAARRDSK